MSHFLVSMGVFIAILSPLVFFHELGHYWVAKLFGVKADVFSIGMGPTLVHWTSKGGTRWQIAAIPFGGYVKFLGDENIASSVGDASTMNTPGSIFSKAPWKRALISLAGPFTNYLIAFLLFFCLFYFHGIGQYTAVVQIKPESAAWRAGLRTGDVIQSINNITLDSRNDVMKKLIEIGKKTPTPEAITLSAKRSGAQGAEPGAPEIKTPGTKALGVKTPVEREVVKKENPAAQPVDDAKTRLEMDAIATAAKAILAEKENPTFLKALEKCSLSLQKHLEKTENQRDGLINKGIKTPGQQKKLTALGGRFEFLTPLLWIGRTLEHREKEKDALTTLLQNKDIHSFDRIAVMILNITKIDQDYKYRFAQLEKDLASSSPSSSRTKQGLGHGCFQHLSKTQQKMAKKYINNLSNSATHKRIMSGVVHTMPLMVSGSEDRADDWSGRPASPDAKNTRIKAENPQKKSSSCLPEGAGIQSTGPSTLQDILATLTPENPQYTTWFPNWGISWMAGDPAFYKNITATDALHRALQNINPWESLKNFQIKSMSGPIGIIRQSGTMANLNWYSIFLFMAMISAGLAFFNLLPFPLLDGGNVLFCVLEMIMGRPLQEKTQRWVSGIALVILLTFILYISFQDLLKIEWLWKSLGLGYLAK